MRFNFTGKNLAVPQDVKDHAEKKMGRLSRLFPDDVEVSITFTAIKQDNKVEVTIPTGKRLLRAEVVSNDMFSAIDGVVDVLDKQRTKYKSQLKDRVRRNAAFKDELTQVFYDEAHDDAYDDAEEIVIERMKQFPLKPMTPEEAVMEMDLSGHTFYVFRNTEFEVNVVYKRRGGTYGLICPTNPADCD
ncbi:MAG: ribosome-associated translation inhibitor RaiA [Defluviitaleaceae bacterium]|nr:ribosome-associated translation inhibitor RaiA [Defluviitaleaceae bacterium]